MIKKTFLFFVLLFCVPLFAQDTDIMLTAEEILAVAHPESENLTPCATQVFTQALYDEMDDTDESSPEAEIRAWAQTVMFDKDVLEEALDCPELKNITDRLQTVTFTPIYFQFPNGREITINYATQLKVLDQKLLLADKPSLPNGDPNPRLMDANDPAKYINTDPAWYAIMVVEHDSLSNFVGPNKNNTLSIKWINDNIDDIYPHGAFCTSKSALANDHYTINQVVHELVDLEKDTNDYYVAGDVNLEWIMYAEIIGEIALTIVTVGAGEAAMIGLKGARAGRIAAKLAHNATKLRRFEHVAQYATKAEKIAATSYRIEKNSKLVKKAKRYEKTLKNIEDAKKAGKDVSKYEKKADKILKKAKEIDRDITPEKLKNAEKLQSETETLIKQLPEMEKELQETLIKNKELLTEKRKTLKEITTKTNSQKIKEYERLQKEMDKIRDSKDYDMVLNKAKNPELQKQADEILKQIKDLENADDFKDYAKTYNEVKDLESVDDYIKTAETLVDIRKYRANLSAYRQQTGNIFTKNLKRIKGGFTAFRTANTGAKTMTKAAKVARAGMSSKTSKIGDWLIDSTLKHGGRIARFERDLGGLYGAVLFLGDLYDRTSNTSQQYSNGIEFKPLCLLSADDLEGQENEVNYGMWLMWTGNSTDSVDDDAAYLQAMDFAEKFNYVLNEYQDEHGKNCNVDIYVVRPIIRLDETNPDETTGELFCLFMNDITRTYAN
ncbi:MAG: hypothetical protein MJ163_00890 [Alphaproteobacteria bacterium]|nr:hypothetical protein [Alphaproteobacteria bacterium]